MRKRNIKINVFLNEFEKKMLEEKILIKPDYHSLTLLEN